MRFSLLMNELVFSRVYMFGLRNPAKRSTYLEIKTPDESIFISENQLFFRDDNTCGFKAVSAQEINHGDKIFQIGLSAEPAVLTLRIVSKVRKVEFQGVYTHVSP